VSARHRVGAGGSRLRRVRWQPRWRARLVRSRGLRVPDSRGTEIKTAAGSAGQELEDIAGAGAPRSVGADTRRWCGTRESIVTGTGVPILFPSGAGVAKSQTAAELEDPSNPVQGYLPAPAHKIFTTEYLCLWKCACRRMCPTPELLRRGACLGEANNSRVTGRLLAWAEGRIPA
jgi:hypothetical protein